MIEVKRRRRHWLAVSAAALGVAFTAAPALAQTASSSSENLAVNLMSLLVKQGVITQQAADGLMAEAQRETAQAQAQAPIATNLPPPAAGATRIPYVPEVVKNQIRDEVRAEVIQQAKAENWAQPNAVPEWTKRLQITGDVRLRYESDFYSNTNDPEIINYAAFNSGGPVNVNANPLVLPILNTRQNRDNQLYIRARLDVLANPSDWVTTDIRLASGTTNSPVSTSQLLGGGLTKKTVWLDRAYIDLHPVSFASGTFGRMPNPFVSTDLVYDTDLNFDGVALHGGYPVWKSHGLSLFASAGAFLTDYNDVNFPTNSTSDQKAPSQAKWMMGGQIGVDWKTHLFDWKTAVAHYAFNAQGQLSQPCALYQGQTQCSSDFSRPAFMQKGNTLFLIRNITPDPSLAPGSTALPQYAGLVFPYRVLDLNSTLAIPFGGQRLELTGDFARNLAYSAGKACRYGELGLPLNNIVTANGSSDTDICAGATGPNAPRLASGADAYMIRATFGHPDPDRWGQWNLGVGYKRLDPDSVLDAYTDADFHLGGTNAKGFFLLATLGLATNTNIQFRWFSANEVSGPPMSIDVGQIDLNTKF
jgi:hypothetical protein